jgi:hypothetical protein
LRYSYAEKMSTDVKTFEYRKVSLSCERELSVRLEVKRQLIPEEEIYGGQMRVGSKGESENEQIIECGTADGADINDCDDRASSAERAGGGKVPRSARVLADHSPDVSYRPGPQAGVNVTSCE